MNDFLIMIGSACLWLLIFDCLDQWAAENWYIPTSRTLFLYVIVTCLCGLVFLNR